MPKSDLGAEFSWSQASPFALSFSLFHNGCNDMNSQGQLGKVNKPPKFSEVAVNG